MYDIQICPVRKLYDIAAEADLGECAAIVVSSYEIIEEKLSGLKHILTMNFDDVETRNHINAFNDEQADQMQTFVDGLPESLDTLFICCDSGESRSPAIAAAIMEHKGLDHMAIWKNPKYHPNLHVCAMLCTSFDIAEVEEAVKKWAEENEKAFRNAVCHN